MIIRNFSEFFNYGDSWNVAESRKYEFAVIQT
jgi:hypothetical protein